MHTNLTPRALMRVGGSFHYDKNQESAGSGGQGDPIATITKSVKDIGEKVKDMGDQFVTKEEAKTLKKSLDDAQHEIRVLRENSEDAKYFGLPFRDGFDFLHTFIKAQMGHEKAKDAIFGEKGYVKVVEHVMQSKFKAPSGFNTQDTEGMFILPEFSNELLRTAPTLVDIRERAKVFSMQGNYYEIPALVDKNHSTSVSGGISVSRTAEGNPANASTAQFEKIGFRPSKLTGLVYITEEMLQDATAFAGLIPQLVRDEFTSQEESDYLYGSGTGEPLGALSTKNPALVTTDRADNDKISALDIATMKSRAYLKNWGNYVWVASQSIIPQLLTLTLGDTPVYQFNYKEGGMDAILGRPVLYSDSAPDLGEAGDLSLVDFSQYAIADKGEVQQQQSIHVRFIYGETAMRFVKRNDARPLWRAPLTPKGGTLTRSPFVRLDA